MPIPELIDTIIQGDAFEVLKTFPNKSVDFVFTSPPFKGNEEKDKRRKNKSDIAGEYWPWYDKFMMTISRITRDYALIFNSSTRMVDIIKRYQTPFRILIWDKVFLQAAYRFEPIFIYKFDANYSLNRYIWKDTFNILPILGSKQKVPYENPLSLYQQIIKMLPENKIILDPCIGFGTTAVACKNLGRHYIGIELNPEYIKIANKRLNFEMLDFGE
jgi:DNA modification methylase